MEWMILPYRRYTDFGGRSQRMEYWMFTLFYLLVIFALAALIVGGAVASESAGRPGELGVVGAVGVGLLILFVLATVIPSIAVQVRRFHDQDKSGWMYLLNFIPYVGGLVVLVFMCLDGTPGANTYGPDPKGREADVFA